MCEILSLTDQSIQAYRLALEKNPKDLAVLCSLARIEQDGGEDAPALGRYLEALEIDERCVAARVGLGQIAARGASDDRAIEHLDIALEEFPYCSVAHAELTRIYSRRGDAKRSEFHKRWSRVGRKTPIHNPLMADVAKLGVTYTARMKRAKSAISHGKWPRALEHLDAAAELRGGLAEPRYIMATPLIRLGSWIFTSFTSRILLRWQAGWPKSSASGRPRRSMLMRTVLEPESWMTSGE